MLYLEYNCIASDCVPNSEEMVPNIMLVTTTEVYLAFAYQFMVMGSLVQHDASYRDPSTFRTG